MRSKTIFLLFVFGALGVLAKKADIEKKEISEENSSDEENENEKDIHVQLQEAFKIEEFPIKLEQLQKPSHSKPPKLPPKGKVNGNRLWSFIEVRMNQFKNKGTQILNHMEKEFEDKKKEYENSLISKHETEKNAEEEGKGEDRIDKFLNKKNINAEITKEKESTFECFDKASEEARETLKQTRDAFDKILTKSFGEVREQAMVSKNCKEKRTKCFKQRLRASIKKITEMVGSVNSLFKKTKEDLEKGKKDMEECRNKFLEKLSESDDTYTSLVKDCGDSIRTPITENNKEDEKEQKGKHNKEEEKKPDEEKEEKC